MAVPVGQRNVADTPATRYLVAGEMARTLALHSIRLSMNERVFTPQLRDVFTMDMVNSAKRIVICTYRANAIRVENADDWKRREALQREAIARCSDMLCYVSMARALFHIRGKKIVFWTKLVIETQDKLKNWHEKDRQRYKNVQ